jgi:excisionase family DNA binding protein
MTLTNNEAMEQLMTVLRNDDSVPLWQKSNLTLDEAAVYSGIGKNRIRQLSDDENCEFVLWVGTKRLIKRKQFDEFISKQYSI